MPLLTLQLCVHGLTRDRSHTLSSNVSFADSITTNAQLLNLYRARLTQPKMQSAAVVDMTVSLKTSVAQLPLELVLLSGSTAHCLRATQKNVSHTDFLS